MTNKSTVQLNGSRWAGNIISSVFGLVAMAIGFVNTFWGNDLFYGIFIFLLAFAFFPPVTRKFHSITGIAINPLLKLLLAAFIIWSAVGVGELFDKVDMMLSDFR